MGLPAFDTHAYVKRLRDAGVSEAQAEAQVELQVQVLSSLVTEKLATKEDITQLKHENAQGFARLENLIKEETASLKAEMKQESMRLENLITQESIRARGDFKKLDWMLGFLVVAILGVLYKLYLHT